MRVSLAGDWDDGIELSGVGRKGDDVSLSDLGFVLV